MIPRRNITEEVLIVARRKKKTRNINHDILGVCLIALGLLMIFSIFGSDSAGTLGRITDRIQHVLLGVGAFLLPIIIIFIGVCMIVSKGNLRFQKKFYGIILFFANTLLLIQLITINNFYVEGNFADGVAKIVENPHAVHGGIISYLLAVPLYKLLGTIGCFIAYAAIYIISLIIIFDITLIDEIRKYKNDRKGKATKKSDPMVQEAAVSETVAEAKGDYISNINKKIKIIDFMKNINTEDISTDGKEAVSVKKADTSVEAREDISKKISEEIIINTNGTVMEYQYPNIELLNVNNIQNMNKEDKKGLLNSAAKLEETLNSFGVEAKVIQVTKGPSVTRYELQPNSGVKVSKIVNLSDDIALGLAAKGVRIEAPIPGKAAVGIEVPNRELMPVYLREVLDSEEFRNSKQNIAFALGKDIAGNCVVGDLAKMPHMLIAGATGSGKSVCINTLIISLLYKYSPDDVKLLMVDPKVVELSIYNGIPHLLIPVVTDPKKAAGALNWAVNEMTRRYKLFADNSVRNVEGYNELFDKGKVTERLPWIVIIVDELADLMMVCPGEVEDYIGRLAQMARAAGMHLVIATQRPSVDVITGVIKANIPSRISFAVSSQIDSRTILDCSGAEKLLGKGDMLFYPVGESKPLRIQGAFICEEEVEKVVEFIKGQKRESEYKEEILNHINSEKEYEEEYDELLEESIRIVVECGQASTSLLQRRLRIGYNRAARIIDQLEARGIISGRDGSKPRQVLVDRDQLLNEETLNED